MKYPPCRDILSIMVVGEDANEAGERIRDAKATIDSFGDFDGHIIGVLGPAPAPIARIKDKFRYRILLKAAYSPDVSELLLRLRDEHARRRKSTEISIDINPVNMS